MSERVIVCPIEECPVLLAPSGGRFWWKVRQHKNPRTGRFCLGSGRWDKSVKWTRRTA